MDPTFGVFSQVVAWLCFWNSGKTEHPGAKDVGDQSCSTQDRQEGEKKINFIAKSFILDPSSYMNS